jgi:hypothetical protein
VSVDAGVVSVDPVSVEAGVEAGALAELELVEAAGVDAGVETDAVGAGVLFPATMLTPVFTTEAAAFPIDEPVSTMEAPRSVNPPPSEPESVDPESVDEITAELPSKSAFAE